MAFNATLASLAGVAVFIYTLGLVIYNKFCHPLRNIPGPFLCAVSWLPWYKYWFSGHMHNKVLRLHEKYGEMVRIGPNEISFVDAAAWKDIYGLPRQKQIQRCHISFPALTPNDSQFDLTTSDHLSHAKYRKILNPSFSDKAIKEYEPALQQAADNLISKLSTSVKNGVSRINITKWYQWVAFDVVGDVVFGDPFDCINEQRNHTCLALSMDLVSLASLIVFVARFTALKMFLVKLAGIEAKFIDMVRSKCQMNADSKSEKANVFSNITKEGGLMNQSELDGNLTALVVAGSETTGFTLTTTSFYLAKNPGCFRKAAEEVRSAFTSEEEIQSDALKKLPYLKATMEEALRMTPAAPNGLARRIVSEGIDIRGHFIRKGTAVYVSQYAANHLSSHFHLPNEYHPERWLGDPAFAADALETVQPFIMGTNVCIGRSLAWMEMRVIMAKMLWNFDWTLDEEDENALEKERAYHLWVKSPLHVKLLKRGTLDLKA